MEDYRVSVIIMTLNAEKYIEKQLVALTKQSVKPIEIIVADSESTDRTVEIAQDYDNVRTIKILRKEFDHGGSRDYALQKSIGDFVFFFTQDAIIEQENFIEIMLKNFFDEKVAMAYGRQLPMQDALSYEKIIRDFNYPDKSIVKDINSIPNLGIKAFYMSDVCSCYRRSIYNDIGGFEKKILTNEDMLIAARAVRAGYKVVYEAKACVVHSHNFSWCQELRRNFDIGAFLKMHVAELNCPSEYGEGAKLVKIVITQLLSEKNFFDVLKFCYICSAKLLGNKLGKMYESLPVSVIRKLLKSNFWVE